MAIYQGSRYQGVPITGLRHPDGTARSVLHRRRVYSRADLGDGAFVHVFQAGEELDLLAWRYGGKARLWWLIADVNDIAFPLEIEPGTRLLIPDTRLFQEAG